MAGLATHINTMPSSTPARTLVTAIIIAIHHGMFDNNGSVTAVTARRAWGAVIEDQRASPLGIFCRRNRGEMPFVTKPVTAATMVTRITLNERMKGTLCGTRSRK